MGNLFAFKFAVSLTCLCGFLIACSTPSFVVKSEPLQADVFIQDVKTGDKKLIGKTPLQMPIPEVKKIAGESLTSGEFFTVSVEKTGFISQSFNVPATRYGTTLSQLDVKLKEGTVPKELRLAKEILDHLFVAQKFAVAQQFERAQIELDKILSPFPDFARALSMRASIYYAQKNYPESLKWYEEALKANPEMDEAVKMVAKVKTLQSGRTPASSTSEATKPKGDR
jgi:tetratricopeptide (TPR) repeat protein